MIFWRIYNNNLYPIKNVEKLGFSKNENVFIPDEYLQNNKFVVSRTCLGIGDWGVISSMPRLLKKKYPNCKVYLPSENLLYKLFHPYSSEWLKSWKNPYETMKYVFSNNPYVDGYVDSVEGDIFHYRTYDDKNPQTPLLEQMLEFWQFTPEEFSDSSPELYFNDDEIRTGNKIINKMGVDEFGTLLISNRFVKERDEEFILKSLFKYKHLPYLYWVSDDKFKTYFDINYTQNLKDIPIRIQMYLKTQSKAIIGNMSGADIMFPRYTNVYMAPREEGFKSNIVRGNLIIDEQNI